MSEELSLITATPVVKLLKVFPYSTREKIEVRAAAAVVDHDLSIHYTTESDETPSANEKLLVAVLAGVHQSWLNPPTNQPTEGLTPNIQFEAVSATPRHGRPAEGHDALRITHGRDTEGGNRLVISMRNESGSVHHAGVTLSKGQVTSMLAALLAIYPRLQEAGADSDPDSGSYVSIQIDGDAKFARLKE